MGRRHDGNNEPRVAGAHAPAQFGNMTYGPAPQRAGDKAGQRGCQFTVPHTRFTCGRCRTIAYYPCRCNECLARRMVLKVVGRSESVCGGSLVAGFGLSPGKNVCRRPAQQRRWRRWSEHSTRGGGGCNVLRPPVTCGLIGFLQCRSPFLAIYACERRCPAETMKSCRRLQKISASLCCARNRLQLWRIAPFSAAQV